METAVERAGLVAEEAAESTFGAVDNEAFALRSH